MKKQNLFSLAVVLLAIGAVTWQDRRHSRLEAETAALRASLQLSQAGDFAESLLTATRPKSEAKKPPSVTQETPLPKNLSEILAQTDPMSRLRGLLGYVEGLSTDQLGKVLNELRSGSAAWDFEAKFLAHMLLSRWGQEDPEAAFASLSVGGRDKGAGDAPSVLASLAALDSKRAVAWLNDPDNRLGRMPKMGHVLAGTIAKEWARQDPAAALTWAAGLPDDQRRGALGGVVESLASTDPKRASEMVMNLDNDRDRRELMGEVAQAWGRQSPDEALAWASGLDGKEGLHVVEAVLDGWAQIDPAAAAEYIDRIPLDQRSDGQVYQVARQWGRRDPEQAAVWLMDQPDGKGKTSVIGEVMWHWTTADPEAASSWLASAPISDASRDNAVAGLAKAAFDTDPSAAVSWALTVSNEEMRGDMVKAGLTAWGQRDPTAASDWAQQHGLEVPAPSEPNKAK